MSPTNASVVSVPSPTRDWDGVFLDDLDDRFLAVKHVFRLTAIIVDTICCPLTVLLNVLVIVAVTTKHRLQTNYHILLACLAVTDVLAGLVSQPIFISTQILVLKRTFSPLYWSLQQYMMQAFRILSLSSLFHIGLLSVERYIAVKHSYQYASLVTTPRLTVAVVLSWICAAFPSILKLVVEKGGLVRRIDINYFNLSSVAVSLFVIIFCHISVFLVSRRHMMRIRTEQTSREANAKFLEENKAWKTTSILIGAVFLSYLPFLLRRVVELSFSPKNDFVQLVLLTKSLLYSCMLLNSLCNPIIYCWRSKVMRQAFMDLLRTAKNRIMMNN